MAKTWLDCEMEATRKLTQASTESLCDDVWIQMVRKYPRFGQYRGGWREFLKETRLWAR
jgi:hypothetical protein